MNKYFEIPEYVEKVSKSRLEKISQKIWFTRKFPKNWRNYEKISLLVVLMELGCGQEIIGSRYNGNTGSKLPLKQ